MRLDLHQWDDEDMLGRNSRGETGFLIVGMLHMPSAYLSPCLTYPMLPGVREPSVIGL